MLLCGRYNPYYGALARRLCEGDASHKFTLQLCFWDAFKLMVRRAMLQQPQLARCA